MLAIALGIANGNISSTAIDEAVPYLPAIPASKCHLLL